METGRSGQFVTDGALPRTVKWLIRGLLPAARAEDILGDLEERHSARVERLGAGSARRRLWVEVSSLLIWRVGLGGRVVEGRNRRRPSERDGMMLGTDFVQDIRFGLRTLGRRPGFAATAVFVLALGIGAPTTVFSLVNRIFFVRPAEVVEPHRLVRLYRSWAPGQGGGSIGNPEYQYYRDHASTLTGLAASSGAGVTSYSLGSGEVDQLRVGFVSANYFDVLGTSALMGRGFAPEENASPGTHPVVVLNYGFWRRALGGDQAVIGSTIGFNGNPFTVIGVMPEAFQGLSPALRAPDAWVPIAMNGVLLRRSDNAWWEREPDNTEVWLRVIGRLAPGVTFEAAEANLVTVDAGMEYEGKGETESVWVRRQFLYSPRQAGLLERLSRMLLAVVGIVLVIAVANVAVLMLSRGSTRHREIGIRTAMGAGRGRIARQLLAESLILGVGGGVLGIGLAYAASDMAASLIPLSLAGTFTPDLTVILAALALSVVTSVAVGLAPALQAAGADIRSAIHGTTVRSGRSRLRGGLVVGQLGLSLMLVAGALLFSKSFMAAHSQELGFNAENRLVVQVNLRAVGYDQERGRAFVTGSLERISAISGVRAVTTSAMVPFRGEWGGSFDVPPGARSNQGNGQVYTGKNVVSPGYFDLMGMEIVRGRALGHQDVQGAPISVVVNEALADAVWPGESAIGKSLPVAGDDVEVTVVGVAATATYYDLGEDPAPQAWGAVQQLFRPVVSFVVETGVPPAELAGTVQDAIRELDPTLAFGLVTTLEEVVEEQVARYEVTAVLVSIFGVIALVLAAAGLYGVVSFLVAQRTREIGVRMALGADRTRVAGEVMRSGLRLVVSGLVLGLIGAVGLRRFTESFLYGVESGDPLPLVGASLLLLLVAAGATFVPARRAAQVDPMVAIRMD